jgi:anti-sigma factor RsiW
MEHLTELQLNEYVDGLLGSAEQARCDAHIDACAECRAELQALRLLVREVGTVARAVPPARDLLPGIHAALEAGKVEPIDTWRTRSLWSLRLPLAAAAILLVIATALVTRALDRTGTAVADLPQPNGSSVLVSREVSVLQGRYESAIAELQQVVQTQRAQLSPATIRVLEENMRIIDRAIRESQEALQADPTNEMVNEMLWSAYEKKLELLRRATTVVST